MAGWLEGTPTKYQHQLWRPPKLYLLFVLFFLYIQRESHWGASWARGNLTQPQLGWHGQLDGPCHHYR